MWTCGRVESPAFCWEAELVGAFEAAGFRDVRVTHRYDCFRGTSKEGTARRYGVTSVNLTGTRTG